MYVYFIECMADMRPVKIGVSWNPLRRLKILQTSNPFKLTLLDCVRFQDEEQAYAAEAKLHERFDISRMNGEWFAGDVYQEALRLCISYLPNRRANPENESLPLVGEHGQSTKH